MTASVIRPIAFSRIPHDNPQLQLCLLNHVVLLSSSSPPLPPTRHNLRHLYLGLMEPSSLSALLVIDQIRVFIHEMTASVLMAAWEADSHLVVHTSSVGFLCVHTYGNRGNCWLFLNWENFRQTLKGLFWETALICKQNWVDFSLKLCWQN